MKTGPTLADEVSAIIELHQTGFANTIEIGQHMLDLKLQYGPELRTAWQQKHEGKPGCAPEADSLVASLLKANGVPVSRTRVSQLSRAGALDRVLRQENVKVLPVNEYQLRPLTRLDVDGRALAKLWNAAVTHAMGMPTPKQVQTVADREYPRGKKRKETPLAKWLAQFDKIEATLAEVNANREAIAEVSSRLQHMNATEWRERSTITPEQSATLKKIKNLARDKRAPQGERDAAKAAEARVRATIKAPDPDKLIKKTAVVEEREQQAHIAQIKASRVRSSDRPGDVDDMIEAWLLHAVAISKHQRGHVTSLDVAAKRIYNGRDSKEWATDEQVEIVACVVDDLVERGVFISLDDPLAADRYLITPTQKFRSQKLSDKKSQKRMWAEFDKTAVAETA